MKTGPKISKIETFIVPPRWLFVRIETEDGAVGWGEASLEGYAEASAGVFEAYRDRFIGADAFRIEDIWQIGYRGGFYRGGPVLLSALSGLEQALWDLKGRVLGLPVWEMLGGRVRDDVEAYAWIGGDAPADVVEAARARKAQGFKAVKMNATPQLAMLDRMDEIDAVVERVRAVQAEGMAVAVDFHGRVHKPMAKALARALEPLRPLFMEEPLLAEHEEALIELARGTTIPIATGERHYSRWGFKSLLASGAVDIIQPDLSHAGGILECRRIAAMAEVYDVAVAFHCPLGPLALGACLQVAACTPNVVIQEMSLGIHYNQGHDLLTYLKDPSVLTPVDGRLAIPAGAGLGVEVDEDAIRSAAASGHRWRNPLWRHEDGTLAEW